MSIGCTQCGAELRPHKDEIFYSCPYCRSTLFIQKGKSVQNYFVPRRVAERHLRSILSTWLARNELNEDISVVSCTPFYFPFWYFQFGGTENYLVPANSSEVEEVKRIRLPPVNLQEFRMEEMGKANLVEPQFLHDVALEKFIREANSSPGRLVSSSLIYLPVWTVSYAYGTDPAVYNAVVEGTGGAVYANVIPAPPLSKLRAVYFSLAYGSLAVFIVTGIASPNVWWRIGLYAVLAPLVFFVGRRIIERYG